jgi:hypothetical protein
LGGGTYKQHCWAYLSSIRQKQLEMMVEMRLPMAAAAAAVDDGIFNNVYYLIEGIRGAKRNLDSEEKKKVSYKYAL